MGVYISHRGENRCYNHQAHRLCLPGEKFHQSIHQSLLSTPLYSTPLRVLSSPTSPNFRYLRVFKCGFKGNFVLSPSALRALVFIVHGAGEHCGPYDEIAQRLKELSLLVFAHDHGESPSN